MSSCPASSGNVCRNLFSHSLCTFFVSLGVSHLQNDWGCDMPAEIMITVTVQQRGQHHRQQHEGRQSSSLDNLLAFTISSPSDVQRKTSPEPHADFSPRVALLPPPQHLCQTGAGGMELVGTGATLPRS